MAKSIHERVRAQLEKKARDEKRAEDAKHDRRSARAERRDLLQELRDDAIVAGDVLPKTKREIELANRAMLDDLAAWGEDTYDDSTRAEFGE